MEQNVDNYWNPNNPPAPHNAYGAPTQWAEEDPHGTPQAGYWQQNAYEDHSAQQQLVPYGAAAPYGVPGQVAPYPAQPQYVAPAQPNAPLLPGLPPPTSHGYNAYQHDAPVQAGWSTSAPPPALATQNVATHLAQLWPQTRLQAQILRGQAEHSTPFVVSFPVGPVSIGVGAGITWTSSVSISLRCRDIDNPNEPCFLQYEGRVERGGQAGLGIGSSGVSATVYGGGGTAQNVGFKRRVDDFQLRKALYQACLSKVTPTDPGGTWLQPYFSVPEPSSASQFALGEVWEETQETRYNFGAMFGCMVQKIDMGVDVEGHFVRRVEKVSDDTVNVTLIPVKFKRYSATTGMLLTPLTT